MTPPLAGLGGGAEVGNGKSSSIKGLIGLSTMGDGAAFLLLSFMGILAGITGGGGELSPLDGVLIPDLEPDSGLLGESS